MVNKTLFALVAVVGMLSATASQTKGFELPSTRKSIKNTPLAIASSTQVCPSLAKASTQPSPPARNGFEIIPAQESQERATLTITNCTDEDAAVKLIDNTVRKTLRFVYVQANHEVRLEKNTSCFCSIRFTTGKNWDQKKQKFLQNPSYFKSLEVFTFFNYLLSISPYSGVYSNNIFTLYRGVNGNAKTQSLREQDF